MVIKFLSGIIILLYRKDDYAGYFREKTDKKYRF